MPKRKFDDDSESELELPIRREKKQLEENPSVKVSVKLVVQVNDQLQWNLVPETFNLKTLRDYGLSVESACRLIQTLTEQPKLVQTTMEDFRDSVQSHLPQDTRFPTEAHRCRFEICTDQSCLLQCVGHRGGRRHSTTPPTKISTNICDSCYQNTRKSFCRIAGERIAGGSQLHRIKSEPQLHLAFAAHSATSSSGVVVNAPSPTHSLVSSNTSMPMISRSVSEPAFLNHKMSMLPIHEVASDDESSIYALLSLKKK